MSALKYIIPALAMASSVQAACSTRGTLTITNTADLAAIATCTNTYTGNIALATQAVGAFALEGPREIQGNLRAVEAGNVTSLSSSSLQRIKGEFDLESLATINMLIFPQLEEVDTVTWIGLPNGLTTIGFDAGVTKVKSLQVSNTWLTSLDGISPTEAETVIVTSNLNFQRIDLALTNVTKVLTITGNPLGLTVALPRLKDVQQLEINNVSSVSLPQLANSDGGVSFYGSLIRSLSLPKLKTTGAFTINMNEDLASVSVPALETVNGAFNIRGNPSLTGALNFPKLERIMGAAYIIGAFSRINMPQLSQVTGRMVISSTKRIDNTVCSDFESLPSNIIQSSLSCKGKAPNPTDSQTGGNNGGNGDGGNGNGGNGAAGHHGASLGLALTAFVALLAKFVVLV